MNETALGQLTPIRASTQMRAAIECLASRYAAMRVAEGKSAEPLLEVFDQMKNVARSGDYDRFFELDRQLHLAIVQLADVNGLDEIWKLARHYQEPFHAQTLHTCWPDLNVLYEAHRSIVDTICDGDAVAAEQAADAHLNAVWYRLAEQTGDASLPDDAVSRVTAYVAFHLHQTLTVNFLAKYVAHVTPGHLARLFREKLNVQITDYIRRLRMQKAAQLLVSTDQAVARIARQVGYQDCSRFAQHFRRSFAMTPTRYRARAGRATQQS